MTWEQKKEIRRRRAVGEGYKKIGAALDISVNTVKSFCRRDDSEADHMSEIVLSDNDLHCLRCHAPIRRIVGRRARKYCSDACRVAYWRVHAISSVKRTCLGCGVPLLGNDRNRKFCSHECYIRHRYGDGVMGGMNERSKVQAR